MQVDKPIYNPPPPGTPLPAPDLSDMDHVHRLIASGTLADALARIVGSQKRKR